MSHRNTVALLRLERQGIAEPGRATPAEVVAWHGVMQGQDYPGALWSVGLRMPGGAASAVERAFAQKAIVRTWALRGTLHLLAAADLRWIVGLVGARVVASGARRHRELGLDSQTLARSAELLARALEGGGQRSRTELLAMLEEHGISTAGQRGYHMLAHAALQGLICQGAAVRNVPWFVAVDDAFPRGGPAGRAEALAELARRYFTSHGPASLKDFAWWSGLPRADARAGLAAAPDLAELELDGQRMWAARDMAEAGGATRAVFLLPGFDEFLLGYADRSAALDAQHAQRIVPGGNGMFMPTIVSDGRVVGTWRRTLARGRATVALDPFRPLAEAELAAAAACVGRYGAFLDMPAELAPLGGG